MKRERGVLKLKRSTEAVLLSQSCTCTGKHDTLSFNSCIHSDSTHLRIMKPLITVHEFKMEKYIQMSKTIMLVAAGVLTSYAIGVGLVAVVLCGL